MVRSLVDCSEEAPLVDAKTQLVRALKAKLVDVPRLLKHVGRRVVPLKIKAKKCVGWLYDGQAE